MSDITERKRAQEVSQEARRYAHDTHEKEHQYVLIIILLLLSMIAPAVGSEEIKIGVLASRNAEDTLKTWQPTAEYLSGEIPRYSFVIGPLDLDEMAPALERKEVDFIITNPGNYVELEANYGATRIATMESMYGGRTYKVFGSVIFRRADRNDIRDLKDLKGKSFMGVRENLFAWQVAWQELKDNGIDPYHDFKELNFSGLPQDLVVYAVRDGRSDAGAVRTSILEIMASEGKINLTDFVVLNQQHDDFPLLHSTRLYPEWAFVKTKHTPDELAEKVVVALLTMPADSAAAKAANAMWTVPLDYQPVHELMKELRTGPYAEYGKITIGEVVRNYWYWIVIAIAAVLFGRAVEMDRRKRAEEAHSMLASIVEFSDDAIIGKTLDGIIISWNPGAEKVYGYSADEVTGKPVSILIPPGHFDEMPKILEKIKQGETIKHYESVRMRKDGREIDVSLTISPIKDVAGKIIGASTIARDITDRKLMEEQLRAASLYTRGLIEISLDPLVTISPQGKITDVNKATELVTGVSREQLIGSDFSDYFMEPEKARGGYQQVFEKGFVKDYPLAIRHISGSITDVLYNASVYKDVAGNVAGVFAAARDITERKKAEEKVHEASRYTRSLIEVSLDPLVTISKDGKITDVNRATEVVTGVSREKLIGSDFSDYFTESEKAREGYQQVFEKGFVKDYPLAIRHVSGSATDVRYNAAVYRDADGNVAGVFAAARDITERKRAEDALRKLNEELELRVEERTSELSRVNLNLHTQIDRRRKIEEAQERIIKIIESASNVVMMANMDGNLTYMNDACATLIGLKKESVIVPELYDGLTVDIIEKNQYQKKIYDFFDIDENRLNNVIIPELFKNGLSIFETNLIHKDGAFIPVLLSMIFHRSKDGMIIGISCIGTNITERKRAEEKLIKSLHEKETLLKEVHHRVKNNLQIVSSMLQLQSTCMKDKEAIQAFREGRNRVNTMALIHEKLYRSSDLAKINFSEYIEELATNLFFFYGINSELIKLKINITDVFFDINTAIPCGLIINELVTNSLKYAFPEGRKGEVNITVQPIKEKFVLTVSDDGAGFPAGMDFRNTETLGLKLVISLTNQLDGTIELDRSAGTCFKITFSELKYKSRG